jgi:LysM repeat protein
MSTIAAHHSTFAPVARPRLRLTARGRSVLLVLVGLPIAAWLLFAQLNGGAATGSLEAGTSVPIVMVQPGESLWTIAERVAPEADPRDVIASIVAFNHLGSSDVMAGQQLGIPAPYNY